MNRPSRVCLEASRAGRHAASATSRPKMGQADFIALIVSRSSSVPSVPRGDPVDHTARMSHAEPAFPVIAEASRRARAPWAASLAGLLFAALFTAGMVLIRSQPFIGADQQELDRLFAGGADTPGIIGGLYLLPFAGVM